MRRARSRCREGCRCEPALLDGRLQLLGQLVVERDGAGAVHTQPERAAESAAGFGHGAERSPVRPHRDSAVRFVRTKLDSAIWRAARWVHAHRTHRHGPHRYLPRGRPGRHPAVASLVVADPTRHARLGGRGTDGCHGPRVRGGSPRCGRGRRGDHLGHLGARGPHRPGGPGRCCPPSARSPSRWTWRARSARSREVERAGSDAPARLHAPVRRGLRARRAPPCAAGPWAGCTPCGRSTSDPAPPPAAYLPLSGGLYRDCLVHDFDILRWVTGREVTEVYATGSDAGPAMFREAGDVDTAAALLTLDDGTLATATATRCNGAGYDVRMELAGERDQIAVGLDDRTPLTSAEPQGPARSRQAVAGLPGALRPGVRGGAGRVPRRRTRRAAEPVRRPGGAARAARRRGVRAVAPGAPSRTDGGDRRGLRVRSALCRVPGPAAGYQVTGRLSGPRISMPVRQGRPAGSASSRSSGQRSRSDRMAMRASMRASGAPRQ